MPTYTGSFSALTTKQVVALPTADISETPANEFGIGQVSVLTQQQYAALEASQWSGFDAAQAADLRPGPHLPPTFS